MSDILEKEEMNGSLTVEKVVEVVKEKFGGKYWTKNGVHRIYFPESGKVKSFIELDVVETNEMMVTGAKGRVQYVGKEQHPNWVRNYTKEFKDDVDQIADFINKIVVKWDADHPIIVGSFTVVSGEIIITDPCYDEKFDYRNGVRAILSVENGQWNAVLLKNNALNYALLAWNLKSFGDSDVKTILDELDDRDEEISSVCVDSGLMSFFDNEQFTKNNYQDILEKLGSNNILEYEGKGVISRTFRGDGFYPLTALRTNKDFNCLFVRFV